MAAPMGAQAAVLDKEIKMNEIRHACIFCKKAEVILNWDKRLHKCSCGVTYQYRPYTNKPGRGYAARQAAKAGG